MATKRNNSRRTAKTKPATRARSIVLKSSQGRRRKSSGSSTKFDIVSSLLMPAAGAGLAIVAGNAIGKMMPSIPYGKALVPFGLAFVTSTMLKQPGLAAGMAAAGGISLLQSLSPSMFADEASSFINESPIPMINFQDDDLDQYQEALINGQFKDNGRPQGSIKYDAMNNPIYVLPSGELTYL